MPTAEYEILEITLSVKLRGNEFQTKMLLKTKIKPQNKHTAIKKAQSQTIIQSSEDPARITVLSQPVQTQTHRVLGVWEEQTYSSKSNKFRRRNWNSKAWRGGDERQLLEAHRRVVVLSFKKNSRWFMKRALFFRVI